MRTYEKYKDSGISWIGKVPDDWNVCKFKYTINIRNGKDYKDVQSDSNNDYPVYGSGGIFAYAKKYLYDGEALLLGRKGTIDKPIYIQKEKFWTVDTMFYGLATNGNVCKYLYYQALTFPFGRYATSTALPSMTQSDLGNNPICLPSIPEQEAIANYLDKKTAEIDKIIAEREKKIELLNELKSSIISRAVTKGINPHAKMKDSGIDWIGEIPEDWQVMKIKHIGKIFSGATPATSNPQFWNGNIKWVTPVDMNGKYIFETGRNITQEGYESCGTNLIEADSIILSTRAPIGKIAINKVPVCTNQGCKSIVCDNINVGYCYYLLSTCTEELNFLGSGTTFLELSFSALANFAIPYPSISEQEVIADYLNKKTEEIDKSISTIKNECILYKEYKQSLISEVVTGKRKVIE